MNQVRNKKQETNSGCCGSYLRQRVVKEKHPILPNPKIKVGINVIYLGAGNISIKGEGTNTIYYASDHSRHFRIYAEDEASVLSKSSVILKP
jgi:hypothetical protein